MRADRWIKSTNGVEHPPGKRVAFRKKDGTLIAVVQIGRSHSLTTTLRREASNHKSSDPSGEAKS